MTSLREIKTRLDGIDHAMSRVGMMVDQNSPPISSSIDPDAFSVAMLMIHQTEDSRPEDYAASQSIHKAHHILNDQHYGTTSLASLFAEIEASLEARWESANEGSENSGMTGLDETPRECQLALHSMAKEIIRHDSMDLPGEDLPPTLPPRDVLDHALDNYFSQATSILPIFRKQSFFDNIKRLYEKGPEQTDMAWILGFNNVILQSLNISPPVAPPYSSSGERLHTAQVASPEKELLRSLVVNYRRGLRQTDRLMEPKLVNVQALLSMVGDILVLARIQTF